MTRSPRTKRWYYCPICQTKLLIVYVMSDKRKVCYHCACRIIKDTQHSTYIAATVEAEF